MPLAGRCEEALLWVYVIELRKREFLPHLPPAGRCLEALLWVYITEPRKTKFLRHLGVYYRISE